MTPAWQGASQVDPCPPARGALFLKIPPSRKCSRLQAAGARRGNGSSRSSHVCLPLATTTHQSRTPLEIRLVEYFHGGKMRLRCQDWCAGAVRGFGNTTSPLLRRSFVRHSQADHRDQHRQQPWPTSQDSEIRGQPPRRPQGPARYGHRESRPGVRFNWSEIHRTCSCSPLP